MTWLVHGIQRSPRWRRQAGLLRGYRLIVDTSKLTGLFMTS